MPFPPALENIVAFDVNWSDFWPNSRAELQDDHDVIVVSITRRVIGVSGVRISLQNATNVTWWKGFALVNAQGQPIGGVVGGEGADQFTERDYTMAEVQSASRLQLWKAKFLGVHTHTYTIADLSPLTAGTVIEFRWVQDTGGLKGAKFQSASFSGVLSQDNQARTVSVDPGTTFSLETLILNDGSTIAFDHALDFLVGSQGPQDNTRWGTNRWALGGVIQPNTSRRVQLSLTAPTQPGSYPLEFRMVQDGVTWFGDTLAFTANVGAAAVPNPPRPCMMSMVIGLLMLNQSPSHVLDGARLVRTQLQQTVPGESVMRLYSAISADREVEAIITSDARLLARCLTFASAIAECAHRSPTEAMLPELAARLPEFEHIVRIVSARGSARTKEQLEEVSHLLREVVAG